MRIAANHQSLQQQLARAIRNQTITLHLAQSQATIPRPSLGWLSRQNGTRPARSCVHFILDHVFELLVVDWAEEGVELVCFAADTGC
jgi:hypothetical protein